MSRHGRTETADAVVVGGGFYGCCIALHLKREHRLYRVVVIEREPELFAHASYGNQARLHNGYHYPRSFTTGYRSRVNLPRFMEQYQDCVENNFTQIYCIARRNSLVTARQFEKFCREIGAPCWPVAPEIAQLFSEDLIEAIFEVQEFAFDARRLADSLNNDLKTVGVSVWTQAEVFDVKARMGGVRVRVHKAREPVDIDADYLFNCTYAGLNHLGRGFGRIQSGLKYEVAEIALIEVPDELADLGITVMDGPFFSMMPFPAKSLYSLSHVRYTPHLSWTSKDDPDLDPYGVLEHYDKRTRIGHMIRDAARYLPSLRNARYRESIFEVKVILMNNEVDDGRPILFQRNPYLPNTYSVLGGKLDNIFDIYEAMTDLKVFKHV